MEEKPRLHRYAWGLAALIPLAVFAYGALRLVWAYGVCCADDAMHAVIAKNLAHGLGYTNTVESQLARYEPLPFDPQVGSGPTIILPAALMIGIAGNTPWAPGLAQVIIWFVLLIGVGLLLRPYSYAAAPFLASVSFLYLCYALMTFHFEQWFALLGEVPAALLLLLGVLLFLRGESDRSHILAGIALALAVQAKLLALLPAAILILMLVAVVLKGRLRRVATAPGPTPRTLAMVGVGFLGPIVLFEIWKLGVVGPNGYAANARAYADYVFGQGSGTTSGLTLAAIYRKGEDVLLDRFGVGLPGLAFLLLLVGLLVWRDGSLRPLYAACIAMTIGLSSWWLFASNGWPRYFIIALIMIIFAAALPFMAPLSWRLRVLYLVVILVVPVRAWPHLGTPFAGIQGAALKPSDKTLALLEASHLLAPNAAGQRIVTEWWATGADLEYAAPDSLVLTTYQDPEVTFDRPFWIFVNTNFLVSSDQKFLNLMASCQDQRRLEGYVLARCASRQAP